MTGAHGFRSDVQGLRAIAVLAVVTFHASEGAWLRGGFAGVDVFFVISGFLICRLLLRAKGSGTEILLDFYRRRCRRLLPALMTMLAISLLAGAVLLTPADYAATARAAAAALLFVANFHFQAQSDYFDAASALNPLLHTWSLAVEEQFYLVFPPVLLVAARVAPRRVGAILGVAAVGSLAISIWATTTSPAFAFYSLPSRAFELLTGAILAVHPDLLSRCSSRVRAAVGVAGLSTIVVGMTFLSEDGSWPGVAALIPCLGTAAVIAAGGQGGDGVGRLLGLPVLQFLGAISYSLYLWHWPVLVFARHWALEPLGPVWTGAAVAVSVLAAWASWRFVERPAINSRLQSRTLLAAALACMLGVVLCAGIVLGNGLPRRFGPEALTAFAASTDYNPRRATCHGPPGTIAYADACRFGAAGRQATIAIWGDSLGAELAVALGDEIGKQGLAVAQITASACPPTVSPDPVAGEPCRRHNLETLDSLVGDTAVTEVIVVGRFLRGDPRPQLAGLEIALLRLVQAGKRVTLIAPWPTQPHDPPTAVGMLRARGGDPATWGLSLDVHRLTRGEILGALPGLVERVGARLIDPAVLFCDEGVCRALNAAGDVIYFDRVHLSLAGARSLVPLLVEPETP